MHVAAPTAVSGHSLHPRAAVWIYEGSSNAEGLLKVSSNISAEDDEAASSIPLAYERKAQSRVPLATRKKRCISISKVRAVASELPREPSSPVKDLPGLGVYELETDFGLI